MAHVVIKARRRWNPSTDERSEYLVWIWLPGKRLEITMDPVHGNRRTVSLRATTQPREPGTMPEPEYLRKLRAGGQRY